MAEQLLVETVFGCEEEPNIGEELLHDPKVAEERVGNNDDALPDETGLHEPLEELALEECHIVWGQAMGREVEIGEEEDRNGAESS